MWRGGQLPSGDRVGSPEVHDYGAAYYMSVPLPLILTRIIFSSIKTKNDLKYCNFFFSDIYF